MKTIYLTDRSRIDTRESCERKRYLNYDFDVNGKPLGIQRRIASLPLLNGIVLHEGHARVLGGQDVESVVAKIISDYKAEIVKRGVFGELDPAVLIREQGALLEGMLRAFVLQWLPRILDEYDVVTIEKPMDWEMAPGLVQKLRFDTVLRRKGDGVLVILDYKTMAYVSDAWAKKLERSRQTSLYILAAQELFGEGVEIAYLGLVKGAWRKDTAQRSPFFGQKIQASPYLYAYALKGDVGTVIQTEYTAKKGFAKVRTYEEMPMAEWIDYLWRNERHTVNEQFTFNPPLAPTPREMNRVRELVVREELAYIQRIDEYKAMRDQALKTGNEVLLRKAEDFFDFVAAPMRENVCYQYGLEYQCAFLDVCFNDGALDNVLEDGAFEAREPHHSTELEEAA